MNQKISRVKIQKCREGYRVTTYTRGARGASRVVGSVVLPSWDALRDLRLDAADEKLGLRSAQ